MTIVTDTREQDPKVIIGERVKLEGGDYKITTSGGRTVWVERKTYQDLYNSLFSKHGVDLREQLYRQTKLPGHHCLLIEGRSLYLPKGSRRRNGVRIAKSRIESYIKHRLTPNIWVIRTKGTTSTVTALLKIESEGDRMLVFAPEATVL